MASKKKELDLGQSASFLSYDSETAKEETEVKSKKRRVNPGKMWRVNLLLDADLQESVILQALREQKNISVFVNDVLKSYLEEHLQK